MRCPYCAEEIQDNAIKCKHCGEWLPGASYFHPAEKAKRPIGDVIAFKVEGETVRVERAEDGRILINREAEKFFEIPKANAGKITEVNLDGHKLLVQYRDPSENILLRVAWWFSGFRISVDGRPVEGTLDDPQTAITTARSALYLYAFFSLVTIFIGPLTVADSDDKLYTVVAGVIFLLIFLLLGVSTNRFPIFTTLLGSLFGVADIFSNLVYGSGTGRSSGFMFIVLVFRGGATLAMIRGLIGAFRLRAFRKRSPGR